MKPCTVYGVCLATLTLTLVSLCSSAVDAKGDFLASAARVERQAGNEDAVAQRSSLTRPNVPQQQTGQATRFQTNPNLRQEASASAGGQVARSQVNVPSAGQQAGASARQRPGGQVSRAQADTNTRRQLLDYPSDLPLTQMTPEMLESFLASEEDVIILTNCFEDFSTCRSKHGVNLIRQLRELGIGGRCKGCTSQEQDHLDQLIYEFIQKFIGRYPKYWRQIVPNIGKFLVPRRSDA